MDFQFWESIFDLFDKCQSQNKSLQLNIDQELSRIIPCPRKIVVDLLKDPPISYIGYVSPDQTTFHFQNNFHLCSIDQNRGGSCRSSSCEELHLCPDYILNRTCSQLKSWGKCSHSHTLSTNHNQTILSSFHLSPTDDFTFQLISRSTKLSLTPKQSKIIVQTKTGQPISDDLIDHWLGEHKSLLVQKRPLNSNTIQFIFDDDEVASMMEHFFLENHSRTAIVNRPNTFDISSSTKENNFNDQWKIIPMGISKNDSDKEKSDPSTFQTIDRPEKVFKPITTDLALMSFGRGRGKVTMNTLSSASSPSMNGTGRFSRRLNSNSSPKNEKKLSLSQRLQSSSDEYSSQQTHPMESLKSSSIDSSPDMIKNKKIDEYNDSYSMTSNGSSPRYSRSENDDHKQNNFNDFSQQNHLNERHTPRLTKKKSPIRSQSPMNYPYRKQFTDQQLCYLLGPGRRQIQEDNQCEIISCLPSGYCRVTNDEQGKRIEKELNALLPRTFCIENVKTSEDLSLLISSSAAEQLFQQSQNDYAIITEPTKIQLNIEVIPDQQRSTNDGPLHIPSTNSSIEILSGNISLIPVDLMICISTSNYLRESVLRYAGSLIQSEYKSRYREDDALLLNGGQTKAQNILFVPWQTETDERETQRTQKSLSDLVQWCIDQAHQRKMKSISFPSIGTGQLNLDPAFVCEAMISAASERLHQYQMNVRFVIYSSTQSNDEERDPQEDECFQVFQIYLDSLREQTKINEGSASAKTKKVIRRDVQCKRLLTLSNNSENHKSLIESLRDLMYEKTLDISLIDSLFVQQIDSMIDVCFKCNVIPRIDFNRKELTLRGDRQSCFQCFVNFRQGKQIYQYSYVYPEDAQKTDEKIFNSFVSLQIDEAFAVGESKISIEENHRMILNIDLKKLQVKINRSEKWAYLVKKQLNKDNKIQMPLAWSLSPLMIRTVQLPKPSWESLKCFQAFEQSMPMIDWQIERIDSIENYPLYIHFVTKKKQATKSYFHSCSYGFVQSIIYYGFHSSNTFTDNQLNIGFTRDVLSSHSSGTVRSTDGKHYLFAVDIAVNDANKETIFLSNDEAQLALPTYLIIYQRRNNLY